MTADRIEATARADRFTAPIAYDWGPHVEPIARTGYEAYFAGRPHRPWDELTGDKTFRWKLAAEDVFSRATIAPERIRAVYLTGYTVDPWDDLAGRFRARWLAVLEAMTTARNAWQQARTVQPMPGRGVLRDAFDLSVEPETLVRQARERAATAGQAAPAGEVANVAA